MRGGALAPPSAMIAIAGQSIQDFANLQMGYNIERRTLITIEAMQDALTHARRSARPQECCLAYGSLAL